MLIQDVGSQSLQPISPAAPEQWFCQTHEDPKLVFSRGHLAGLRKW